MAKIKEKVVPFEPVEDPEEIKNDPTNKRVLDLFDALRRRNVGPERAAYCVSQVHGAAVHAYPAPKQ